MSQYPPQGPWQQPQQWQGQPPQQPYYQQPPPQYQRPPVMPPGPPQQPPRKKSSRRAWIIIGVIVLILIIASAANANKNNSSTPTIAATATDAPIIVNSQAAATPIPTATPKPQPTHAPKWTTFQTFTGTGDKTTATFQTSGDWRIVWTATASSESEAFFGVSVYGSDGSITDPGAANATIPAGQKSSDSTDEHTGAGSFYLKIYAGIPWTIMVQQME